MVRATAIISQGALVYAPRAVTDALATLRVHGWEVSKAEAGSREEASELARRALDAGHDLVIAAGGDGTFAAVAGTLRDTGVALAPIPAGTANGWAREMGISLNPRLAAVDLLTAKVKSVDVGCVRTSDPHRAGEHAFLATAGVGYDAAVIAATSPSLKRRLRVGAYVVSAVRTWPAYRGARVTICADGLRLESDSPLVSIGNTRKYGGILTMLPSADNTDGLLDVCVFKGRSLRHRVGHVLQVLLGRHVQSPAVRCFRLPAFTLESDTALPVQADGDHVGTTPISVICYHRSLRVWLPARRISHA